MAKADGNTVRTQRTRSRVLAEALRLFNERGEAHVTTGVIAAELDMSPGNLYYHFRNKDQIVEELFARFEERIDIDPRTAPDGPGAIEDLWLYLHLMFEGIWEFRFLYRNLDDLVSRNRRLRERFNRIIERKSRAIVALCEGLVGAGAMRASPAEIRSLVDNVLVVATYWLNYRTLRSRRPADASSRGDSADLGQGAYQVMTLVAPYLLGEAREHLDLLGRNYID
ncbi:MAG: TetR/AcrR family transcriptional regulator [Usitatibacter sp.]